MEVLDLIAQTSNATLRLSTTLILAAMAGLISEKSGVINIALEGKMLASAFTGASVAAVTGSPILALVAAILVAIAFSLLHGLACIIYKGEQVISGLAINLLSLGLTTVLGVAIFGQGGRTPSLDDHERFLPIKLPFADLLADIPIIGQLYSVILSGNNIFVYMALASPFIIYYFINNTPWGLNIRAVGDKPVAAAVAGVSVYKTRFLAQIICGIFVGLSGAYISMGQNPFFIKNMTAGQGYIALAAVIFGKWRPWQAFAGCLLFGLLDALSVRLQGLDLPIVGIIPLQIIQALPYALTVILLAGFIGKARAPAAIGIPYDK